VTQLLLLITQLIMVVLWYTTLPEMSAWLVFLPAILWAVSTAATIITGLLLLRYIGGE
jgi:hypothetical protein